MDVQSDILEVSKITGYHHYRKSNFHVLKLEFNRHQWAKYLPNGFGKIFPNMIEMEIRETPLKTLRRSNFVAMTNMVVLLIEDTRIAELAGDTFAELINLQELSISRSFLKALPTNIFLPLKNLRYFDGKHNKITELERDLFRGNMNIELINLIGNYFNEIKVDFAALPKIIEVYLLQCGCINSYYLMSSSTFSLADLQSSIRKRCYGNIK